MCVCVCVCVIADYIMTLAKRMFKNITNTSSRTFHTKTDDANSHNKGPPLQRHSTPLFVCMSVCVCVCVCAMASVMYP